MLWGMAESLAFKQPDKASAILERYKISSTICIWATNGRVCKIWAIHLTRIRNFWWDLEFIPPEIYSGDMKKVSERILIVVINANR